MKNKKIIITFFFLFLIISINGCITKIHTIPKPNSIILCENVNTNCDTYKIMETKCLENCKPYDYKIIPLDKKILCECSE